MSPDGEPGGESGQRGITQEGTMPKTLPKNAVDALDREYEVVAVRNAEARRERSSHLPRHLEPYNRLCGIRIAHDN